MSSSISQTRPLSPATPHRTSHSPWFLVMVVPAKVIQLTHCTASLRPASLSRPLNSASHSPALAHSLYQKCSSVLSLAADSRHIYSGSQADDILVRVSCDFISLSATHQTLLARFGTRLPSLSNLPSKVTQEACSLYNMHRIEAGYSALLVRFVHLIAPFGYSHNRLQVIVLYGYVNLTVPRPCRLKVYLHTTGMVHNNSHSSLPNNSPLRHGFWRPLFPCLVSESFHDLLWLSKYFPSVVYIPCGE